MSQFAGISPISAMAPQPPYIRFEKRAVEKRDSVEKGGGSHYVDVDYALVTPHGSKDTVEKAVDGWFKRLREEVRQGRFSQEWLNAYQAAYSAWKNDQEPPLNGQDIKAWPALSPAECKMLVNLRVLTVEALAQANEELLSRIGMGARALKEKANNWLVAQADHVPIVTKIAALETAMKGLEAQVAAQKARADAAEQELKAARGVQVGQVYGPPPAARLEQAPEAPDDTDALIADGVDDGFRPLEE